MDLTFNLTTMPVDTYGILHNSILLKNSLFLWRSRQDNVSEMTVVPSSGKWVCSFWSYTFKLDLVPLVRIKLGPLERWPLIPRITICCPTDYVRNGLQATPANSSSQNTPHKMQNADPSGRTVYSGSVAARLLELRVRITPEAWVSVSCQCWPLSGKGLWNGPIFHPEEPYRVWCILEQDQVQDITLNLQWLVRRDQTKKEREKIDNFRRECGVILVNQLLSETFGT